MTTEPVTVALIVVNALESLGVSYLIGGSFASTAYGQYRTTMDVDLVADLQPDQVDLFVSALDNAFYADVNMIHTAIQRKTSFNLIHLQTMFKVDVFIPKARSFDQEQLKRRVRRVIAVGPERTAYFATAEDTVLAKLEWYQLSGEESERQWRDILGIVQVRGELLDLNYMRKWAAKLNLQGLLERALSTANRCEE